MSTNKMDTITDDQVNQQCAVKTTTDLINTDIAYTFAEHGAEISDYKPEVLLWYFDRLKTLQEGKKLSSVEWARLLEILNNPKFVELLSRFVSKHKNIFSGTLSHLDDDNNLQYNEHPLFDKDGKFIGFDRLKEHIVSNTESTTKNSFESVESSEQTRMTAEQIQKAVDRNTYNTKFNDEKRIREVCSTINYKREELGNGREKHTINGKVFSFPKSNEFTFWDMKDKNNKYTMDIVSKEGKMKYKKFQDETGMNKLSLDKVYVILWEFAQAMGITSPINYDFFKWNSAESQWLLQMFRNITGFEGRIPFQIKSNWYVQYLFCRYDDCWFYVYNYGHFVNFNVAFLSGL